MDPELERTLSSLNDRASCTFKDFMTRVAMFEELTDIGNGFLQGFRQELEFFRRPPLHKTSNVVEKIIRANNTRRMVAYVEAGFRHAHVDIQNTSKLYSCQKGLQDHLNKVKVLIDELEGLSQDAIRVVQDANESTSHLFDKCTSDGLKDHPFSFKEYEREAAEIPENDFWDEIEPVQMQCERILNFASMMRIIYSMLNLDYAMQEKIVLSLNLNSSSDELGSYCLMWELRPFIDDKVMRQCWKIVQ